MYSSISAFGYLGRRGTWRGREELGQAVAGLQDQWRNAEGEPCMMSFPVSDVGSGHLAAFGILLSLYHRRRTGEGQSVSSSLAHTATFIQAPFMLAAEGVSWDLPTGQEATGWGPLHRIHRARDRYFFVVADTADGVEGIVEGEDLEAIFLTASAKQWVDRFVTAGHSAHVVATKDELVVDPYVRRRGLVLEVADGELTIGTPPRTSATPARSGRPGTVPGIDGRSIVEELGLGDRWATLVESGAAVEVLNV